MGAGGAALTHPDGGADTTSFGPADPGCRSHIGGPGRCVAMAVWRGSAPAAEAAGEAAVIAETGAVVEEIVEGTLVGVDPGFTVEPV
jgi:hypothetical protein